MGNGLCSDAPSGSIVRTGCPFHRLVFVNAAATGHGQKKQKKKVQELQPPVCPETHNDDLWIWLSKSPFRLRCPRGDSGGMEDARGLGSRIWTSDLRGPLGCWLLSLPLPSPGFLSVAHFCRRFPQYTFVVCRSRSAGIKGTYSSLCLGRSLLSPYRHPLLIRPQQARNLILVPPPSLALTVPFSAHTHYPRSTHTPQNDSAQC